MNTKGKKQSQIQSHGISCPVHSPAFSSCFFPSFSPLPSFPRPSPLSLSPRPSSVGGGGAASPVRICRCPVLLSVTPGLHEDCRDGEYASVLTCDWLAWAEWRFVARQGSVHLLLQVHTYEEESRTGDADDSTSEQGVPFHALLKGICTAACRLTVQASIRSKQATTGVNPKQNRN